MLSNDHQIKKLHSWFYKKSKVVSLNHLAEYAIVSLTLTQFIREHLYNSTGDH